VRVSKHYKLFRNAQQGEPVRRDMNMRYFNYSFPRLFPVAIKADKGFIFKENSWKRVKGAP